MGLQRVGRDLAAEKQRAVKFTETESRMKVARGWGGGENWEVRKTEAQR